MNGMAAKYILAAWRSRSCRGGAALRAGRAAARDAAVRTWLLIAFIFTAIAAWLQWHTS
jgi:hypothetical protein